MRMWMFPACEMRFERHIPTKRCRLKPEQGKVVVIGKVSSKAVADDILRMASDYSKNVVDSTDPRSPSREKQIMLKVHVCRSGSYQTASSSASTFSARALRIRLARSRPGSSRRLAWVIRIDHGVHRALR